MQSISTCSSWPCWQTKTARRGFRLSSLLCLTVFFLSFLHLLSARGSVTPSAATSYSCQGIRGYAFFSSSSSSTQLISVFSALLHQKDIFHCSDLLLPARPLAIYVRSKHLYLAHTSSKNSTPSRSISQVFFNLHPSLHRGWSQRWEEKGTYFMWIQHSFKGCLMCVVIGLYKCTSAIFKCLIHTEYVCVCARVWAKI